MTSLSPQDQAVEIQEHHEESHPDHRMFGLATFLVADAMTFAGFSLPISRLGLLILSCLVLSMSWNFRFQP